jgi:hypothetical protein
MRRRRRRRGGGGLGNRGRSPPVGPLSGRLVFLNLFCACCMTERASSCGGLSTVMSASSLCLAMDRFWILLSFGLDVDIWHPIDLERRGQGRCGG